MTSQPSDSGNGQESKAVQLEFQRQRQLANTANLAAAFAALRQPNSPATQPATSPGNASNQNQEANNKNTTPNGGGPKPGTQNQPKKQKQKKKKKQQQQQQQQQPQQAAVVLPPPLAAQQQPQQAALDEEGAMRAALLARLQQQIVVQQQQQQQQQKQKQQQQQQQQKQQKQQQQQQKKQQKQQQQKQKQQQQKKKNCDKCTQTVELKPTFVGDRNVRTDGLPSTLTWVSSHLLNCDGFSEAPNANAQISAGSDPIRSEDSVSHRVTGDASAANVNESKPNDVTLATTSAAVPDGGLLVDLSLLQQTTVGLGTTEPDNLQRSLKVIQSLQSLLHDESALRLATQRRNVALQSELAAKNNEVATLKRQIAEVTQKANVAEKFANQFQETLTKARKEATEEKSARAKLETQKNQLTAALSKATVDLRMKTADCNRLTSENARLQAAFIRMSQQIQGGQMSQSGQQELTLDNFFDCNLRDQLTALLDTQFNYDYRKVPRTGVREQSVNGSRFFPPFGCVKFAIKVTGVYDDDRWFDNRLVGSWPTAFHGTNVNVVRTILLSREFKTGVRDILQPHDGRIGFWASSDPQESLKYAVAYPYKNAHYKALFQVRLRPGTFHLHDTGEAVNYRILNPHKDVRAVALCIFKVGDPGPDGHLVG